MKCNEVVFSDLCGPLPVPLQGGTCYFMTFINNYLRRAQVYILKTKADALGAFKDYVLKCPSKLPLHHLVTNQGSEYLSNEMRNFMSSKGMTHATTPAHTLEFNGVAEHFNQTILNMVQCMLHNAGLDHELWAEALWVVMIIYNLSPHKANASQSPLHLWTGEWQDASHIHVFGCHTHLLIPLGQWNKLDNQSWSAIYLSPA